jgi:hypothetical protein
VDLATLEETLQCTRCSQVLDVTEFGFKYPDRPLRVRRCRVCVRELSRMYYMRDPAPYKARAAVNNARIKARNRQNLREYLAESCCKDCGLRDFVVLEFDHRDPETKRRDVSTMVGRALSWATISLEIAKCDVVCANCHRRRTARHFGWRKLLGIEALILPPLPKRGTPGYEQVKSTRSRLARQHRNRTYLYAYLRQHPCERCGQDDPVVLDFDHLRDKLREVTLVATFGGWADLLIEIDKCRVLCANCHRRETATSAGRDR